MSDRKPWWRPWRLCRRDQWVDKRGRTWHLNGGKWWRNDLSIYEMLTFNATRTPPRRFGPYRKAEVRINPRGITDLCAALSWPSNVADQHPTDTPQ